MGKNLPTEGKPMRGKRIGGVALLSVLAVVGATVAAGRANVQAAEQGGHGAAMESMGQRLFQGKSGPWNAEVRLIDMKAQLEKSGVSAKTIERLGAKYHLMVILTDPKSGKPVTDVIGEVIIRGPDKASSSKVELVVMGAHIGADVPLPKPGKYDFRVTVVGGGQRGYAVFDYKLKQ